MWLWVHFDPKGLTNSSKIPAPDIKTAFGTSLNVMPLNAGFLVIFFQAVLRIRIRDPLLFGQGIRIRDPYLEKIRIRD
jgi:hypothetical protein